MLSFQLYLSGKALTSYVIRALCNMYIFVVVLFGIEERMCKDLIVTVHSHLLFTSYN